MSAESRDTTVAVREPADMTECIIGYVGDPAGMVYDARHWKRATAQHAFAYEWGVDFAAVRCRTVYARWLTRSEQWDGGASDQWADDWVDNHDPELHLNADLKWCLPDGTICEPPEPPAEPPDEWEPDENVPAWTTCEKTHPAAVKVYICEPRDA